jgi:hypothetical protein
MLVFFNYKTYETNFIKFELLIIFQHYKKHNPIFLNFFDVIKKKLSFYCKNV